MIGDVAHARLSLAWLAASLLASVAPALAGPTLVYSTYLGGSGNETTSFYGVNVAVDAAGNAYVTGLTWSLDFPTAGPMQPGNAGSCDGFVAKLDPTGSTLLWSTYLGGSQCDAPNGIAVDSTGHVYIAGLTPSPDFPTVNTLQPFRHRDLFVSELAPDGASLVYSTFYGAVWGAPQIAVDPTGAVVVASFTNQPDFPVVNAFQPQMASMPGDYDAVILKLAPSGTSAVYASYLGGTAEEAGFVAIAADAQGNAFLAGRTHSSDFPTVAPLQGSRRGTGDGFVAKVSPDGALLRSTYFGGSGEEAILSVAVDDNGFPYVAGVTGSSDLPTRSAYQPQFGGQEDGFVAKLDPDLSQIVYCTYLGGSRFDGVQDLAVDAMGNVYATGSTDTGDFPPSSVCPLQPALAGNSDAYLVKLEASGATLGYATYLGGSDGDFGIGIAATPGGDAVVAGLTSSTDFPTARAFQPAYAGGNSDDFVSRITACGNPPARIENLKGVKRLPVDAWFGWSPDPLACPGYNLYTVDAKPLIPRANIGRSPLCTTTPSSVTECLLSRALLPPPELAFYQVTGLCTSEFEGPL